MIIDTLKNAHLYYNLAPGIKEAFKWIKANRDNLENMEEGAYEVDGKKVVALVQEYTTRKNPPLEMHDYHFDIQFLSKGEEVIGYYPHMKDVVEIEPYNKVTDCYLYEDINGADWITLKDDKIMILFPKEGHVPRKALNEPMPVKKIVVKVML